MEYFIGSFVTLLVITVAFKLLPYLDIRYKPKTLFVTQSKSFEMISPFMLNWPQGPQHEDQKETQSRKHIASYGVRIVFYNDNAYWLYDNVFYTAKVINGSVDHETAKVVDTMSMSNVELKELAYIVERLTEGKGNDSSNSGNQKL